MTIILFIYFQIYVDNNSLPQTQLYIRKLLQKLWHCFFPYSLHTM
jgi:hypothetical protein